MFHAETTVRFSRASSAASSSAGERTHAAEVDRAQPLHVVELDARGRSVTQSCGDRVTTTGSVSQANTMPGMPSLPACANMLVGSVSLMPNAHLATVLLVAGAIDHRVIDVVVEHAHRHARWPSCRGTTRKRGFRSSMRSL